MEPKVKTQIQNCCFFDTNGNRIDCNASVVDMKLEYNHGPESEVIGRIRKLDIPGSFSVTIENPKLSFRWLVMLLGFKRAVKFKLRHILKFKKEM